MQASGDGGLNIQSEDLQRFNNIVAQRKMVSDLCDKIDRKKFGDIIGRRSKFDPIIKVRCIKTKDELLKIHLVRKKAEYEYTEVVFSRDLVKYGYIEWIQILEIIGKHKGIRAQEVKLALQHLINKVKNLNLVPSVGYSQQSSSSTTPKPRMTRHTKYFLLFGTLYINNKLPIRF